MLKKRFILPGWCFITGMLLLNEICMHLWISTSLMGGRVLVISLFSLSFGLAGGLLSALMPGEKSSKITAVVFGTLITVIWLMEYFILDAYQHFMVPSTILNGAGGVASDYLPVVLGLLGRNVLRIALLLAPSIIYAVWGTSPKVSWLGCANIAVAAAICLGLGLVSVNLFTADAGRLGDNYEFDRTTRSVGMSMALTLESFGTPGGEVTFTQVPVEVEEAPTQEPQGAVPEETREAPIEYGYQTMEGFDPAVFAETVPSAMAKEMSAYMASQPPAKKNAYTGLFQGKNLILITAESFTREVIDPELTPTLYRLANEGIQFKDYYQPAWGGSTIAGEFSNLSGLVPNGGSCMYEFCLQNFFLTMGHQLGREGYFSLAAHNNDIGFYDRRTTHNRLGYDKFLALYGGLDHVQAVWPESDLEMVEETVPMFIDQQPFNVYYLSVSGHCTYSYDGNAMARKNWDKVSHLDLPDTLKSYYASQLELEAALRYLVDQLEKAGIADDTVIAISPDHYPYALERSDTWGNTENYLEMLYGGPYDHLSQDHNALIIWSGAIEGQNIQVDTPVYSLDLLPTLLNLFGCEYDSRLLIGRDVFSDQSPLVLWPDYSWKTDKGTYNSQTDEFVPAEGVTVGENYVVSISAIVKNKVNFSRSVLGAQFYAILGRELGYPTVG